MCGYHWLFRRAAPVSEQQAKKIKKIWAENKMFWRGQKKTAMEVPPGRCFVRDRPAVVHYPSPARARRHKGCRVEEKLPLLTLCLLGLWAEWAGFRRLFFDDCEERSSKTTSKKDPRKKKVFRFRSLETFFDKARNGLRYKGIAIWSGPSGRKSTCTPQYFTSNKLSNH